jgi:TatD DNase family protein
MLDSHCHLNDKELYDKRAEVVARANAAGVSPLCVIAWDLASARSAVNIAHEFPGVYAMVGFQPENLEEISEEAIAQIKELASDEKVIAIGEIGLDYHWYKEAKDRENQKKWFIRQIELANECHLPISIHAREALQDTYDILKAHPVEKRGVLHCYSGSPEMLLEFAKLGYYFGFDGPITYKNAIAPKACVKVCPLDRLLSETDSPYLPPTPYRGTTNEPVHILEIVKEMALLRGCDEKSLENQILLNFQKCFHVEQ